MNIMELIADPAKAPPHLVFAREDGQSGYYDEGRAFLDQCYVDTGVSDSTKARLNFWNALDGPSNWSHDISDESKLGAFEHLFIGKLYPTQIQTF